MKYLFILLITILSLSSCEDFFSTTLDAEPPKFENKLVSNMEIIVGEDQMTCEVSHNTSSFQDQIDGINNFLVDNARINLSRSDNSLSNFKRTDYIGHSYFLYYSPLDIDMKPEETYTLEVSHNDYSTIYGTAKVPSPVSIKELSFDTITKNDMYGGDHIQYTFSFVLEDDIDEDNYYSVSLIQNDSSYEFSSYIFSDLHPEYLPADEGNSLIFKDDLFKGKDNNISFNFDARELNENLTFSIEVKSISKDLFLFKKTYEANRNQEDNPFSSPIQVFSNMENGLGIFAISNRVVKKVQ